MVLNKMKNIKGQSGFTIVELLIVIVVIGILAAITIVAYSGITARAKGATAAQNATSIQSVAEAYNADTGAYGTLANLQAAWTNQSTRLPSGITVSATAPTTDNGTVNISYVPKATTGACIGYWNFSAATPAVWYVAAGNAVVTTNTTCA